jgi:hypothetical protein
LKTLGYFSPNFAESTSCRVFQAFSKSGPGLRPFHRAALFHSGARCANLPQEKLGERVIDTPIATADCPALSLVAGAKRRAAACKSARHA